MPEIVYILCALTSVLCAGLLIRSYRGNRSRLLLWSTLCFFGLAINNIFVVVDLVLVPDIDFRLFRSIAAVTGMATMVIGLIWESK